VHILKCDITACLCWYCIYLCHASKGKWSRARICEVEIMKAISES